MSISVVIPTLDEQATIEATLRNTCVLGFEEIIVVDGGSADHTRTAVEAVIASLRTTGIGNLRLLSSSPGRAPQMNAGAAAARGDVLLFLHADTHLPSSAAAGINKAMADGLTVGGRFDVQFDSRSLWSYCISGLMNIRSRMTGIATGDQALFVKTTVFREMGGFADIPLMEDIEFSRRMKRRGRTAALRDRVTTSFRRWHDQGPLRTIALMWMLRFLYWVGVSPQRLADFYRDVR